MKLKNKKTGEIGTLMVDGAYNFVTNLAVEDDERNRLGEYDSLAELNEEWEDYEEPETFWYMTAWGDVKEYSQDQFAIKQKQEIGNYFDTREEAEKAVERLKAWKRLKDKGFRFDGWEWRYEKIRYELDFTALSEEGEKEAEKDLDLLFGGEE